MRNSLGRSRRDAGALLALLALGTTAGCGGGSTEATDASRDGPAVSGDGAGSGGAGGARSDGPAGGTGGAASTGDGGPAADARADGPADTGPAPPIISGVGFRLAGGTAAAPMHSINLCLLRASADDENGNLDCASATGQIQGGRLLQTSELLTPSSGASLCLHVYDPGAPTGARIVCPGQAEPSIDLVNEMGASFKGSKMAATEWGFCGLSDKGTGVCRLDNRVDRAWYGIGSTDGLRWILPYRITGTEASGCYATSGSFGCFTYRTGVGGVRSGPSFSGDFVEGAVSTGMLKHVCLRTAAGTITCADLVNVCARPTPDTLACKSQDNAMTFPAGMAPPGITVPPPGLFTNVIWLPGPQQFCGAKSDGTAVCWAGAQAPAAAPLPAANKYVRLAGIRGAMLNTARSPSDMVDLLCGITADRRGVVCSDGRTFK